MSDRAVSDRAVSERAVSERAVKALPSIPFLQVGKPFSIVENSRNLRRKSPGGRLPRDHFVEHLNTLLSPFVDKKRLDPSRPSSFRVRNLRALRILFP